jgi:hypothetical protein
MRTQIVRAPIATILVAASVATSPLVAQSGNSPSRRADCFFDAIAPVNARAWLDAGRPQPVDSTERARILATLPSDGELEPQRREAATLALLEPILRFHRRDAVYTVKLIDVPQAIVGLHKRAVLIISRAALGSVTGAELQALTAHEIGHEFFWVDYETARARDDMHALRELELKSDGVAVLTMLALGLEPTGLVSGERKLTRFNEVLGATANATAYPTLGERLHLARRVAARFRPALSSLTTRQSDVHEN